MKKREKGADYVPAQDMIDADNYQTSSNPVSEDMVKSRKKAQEFEWKRSRETTITDDDKNQRDK